MNRFNRIFQDKNKKIFVPFFTLGDPNKKESLAIIKTAVEAGADALELGFPFSDPIADGPTNQRSMARALKSGANFEQSLAIIAEIRDLYPNLPIGLLMYYNLLFRQGSEGYRKLAQAGVDAIVSADLPIEEACEHNQFMTNNEIGCVQMIAPNTPKQRAVKLFELSSAFTYVLSGFGTTGVKTKVSLSTLSRVKELKMISDKPIIVGFGISQPEHVKAVWDAGANGVIVGSCFTSIIERNLTNLDKARLEIEQFVKKVLS